MSRSTANLYVGANHQLTFGKHKGKLLGDLIMEDYRYILYLHNKKILKIEHWIVDIPYDPRPQQKELHEKLKEFRFSGGVTTIAQPSFWTGSTAIWKPRINLK